MPPKKKKSRSKKRKKQKRKTIPKKERLELYGQLYLANPHQSYKSLHEQTGIPIGTIKWDFHQLRKQHPDAPQPQNGTPPSNPPASTTQKPQPPTPSQPLARTKGSFDWDSTMDKMGQIAASVTAATLRGSVSCPHCQGEVPVPKDDIGGRMWMDTFGRLFGNRMRAEMIFLNLQQAGPRPEPEAISRAELLAAIRSMDVGPECVLCGSPRPGRQVIDVEYKEVKK